MVDGTEQARAFTQGRHLGDFNATHVSHKHVEAYPLLRLVLDPDCDRTLLAIVEKDGAPVSIKVPGNIAARGTPLPGSMLVRYAPTDSEPDGYFAFSPRVAFESGYRPVRPATFHPSHMGGGRGLTFGQAIEQLKAGDRVARDGWNGKGMHLSLVTAWAGNVGPAPEQYALLPFICMRTAQADFVPWFASQADMLAEDWCVV